MTKLTHWKRFTSTATGRLRTATRAAPNGGDVRKQKSARLPQYAIPTQSLRLSTVGLQLAVGGLGLGPIEQEEQGTQRAPFVATYHTSTHSSSRSSCGLGSSLALSSSTRKRFYTHRSSGQAVFTGVIPWLQKHHLELLGTSLRGQTKISQRRLGCLRPGPSQVHHHLHIRFSQACLFCNLTRI